MTEPIVLDTEALDAAMEEAGSGWGMHLDPNAKRWLMSKAISAYLAALSHPPKSWIDWKRQAEVLRAALAGEPDTPPCISPLAWLHEAIEELKRRGPDKDCEDPDAFWTMVNECEALEKAGTAALAGSFHP